MFLGQRHDAEHEVASPLGSWTPERKQKVRAILRWWRAPIWVLALATGAKSFADNPILGSAGLNRRGLHVARLKLAHDLAWMRRRRLAAAVPAAWREQFDSEGFIEIRDFLAPETFSRLRSALIEGDFEARRHQQGDTVTRRIAVGPELLRQVPELRSLIRNKSWKDPLRYIASTYAERLHYRPSSWGTHPARPIPSFSSIRDTFHPLLKAWLFLSDVTDDQGPLTYVPGSPRLTPQRLDWEQARSERIAEFDRLSQRGSFRIATEELPSLGLPQPKRFAVPANTLVAIDTCGFHARGSSTRSTVRVELWAYTRRTPFLPWAGFDLLS